MHHSKLVRCAAAPEPGVCPRLSYCCISSAGAEGAEQGKTRCGPTRQPTNREAREETTGGKLISVPVAKACLSRTGPR